MASNKKEESFLFVFHGSLQTHVCYGNTFAIVLYISLDIIDQIALSKNLTEGKFTKTKLCDEIPVNRCPLRGHT